VDGLAAAIGRMLRDVELRRRCIAGGSELIARQFASEQMVAGNLAVYREVLAERAARPLRNAA
jgi:hypothetical protein